MFSRIARRGFVTMSRTMRNEAGGSKTGLSLQLVTPTETIFSETTVHRVFISTKNGDMGIMANHVPAICELRPGVVRVEETESSDPKKFFVPGGFALVQADSVASITCSEAIPLDDLDESAVASLLSEAEAATKTGDDKSKIEAEIAVEVYKSMAYALSQK